MIIIYIQTLVCRQKLDIDWNPWLRAQWREHKFVEWEESCWINRPCINKKLEPSVFGVLQPVEPYLFQDFFCFRSTSTFTLTFTPSIHKQLFRWLTLSLLSNSSSVSTLSHNAASTQTHLQFNLIFTPIFIDRPPLCDDVLLPFLVHQTRLLQYVWFLIA